MIKQNVRSFALGMLITVSSIGSYYYFFIEEKDTPPPTYTLEDAKERVKKENLVILENSEYQEMQDKINSLQKDLSVPQSVEENVPETNTQQEETTSYTLQINSGMSISTIAETLFENKIIGDKGEFERYVTDNGYHTDIQVGSFPLNSDMSLKKIAEILTE
ncbi:endolytic transglycosylase MltG [Bacillus sp. B1-b2]|uniref:endolytic transglycosylase MltG n=1 Tax=Bacillus sp. B1-b2 TaxID=2653201 RepID=UPI001261BF1A|nr:endolytic transglycosylase MltG [Bacillus sp. B1-b2]KAB7670039.1 endolytic transglycosylase MltG [Bacillus sp. B1-b2]